MILDYNYSKKRGEFSISYVTPSGGKKIIKYNVNRFKSYASSPSGKFINFDGTRCTPKWVEKPGWTEFKTFIEELPEQDKKLLLAKHNPQLYTFDIEVDYEENVFPEPDQARWPILTISVVNSNLDSVVLGTKELGDSDKVLNRYHEWLNTSDFFKKLGLKMPRFQYIKFDTESEMIEYFFKNILSKCPVVAGWNSLGFDWNYFQNRVKYYYPNISMASCSPTWEMTNKMIEDFKGQKIRLNIPVHTLVLDMMDIIGTFDMAVMPIKENLSLDYIAYESIGMHKIEYDGDLKQLYNRDYETYVFYNLIDSVLVQLIDKRFKTLDILYTQSLICRNKIQSAMSKIAITESMFFNHWFDNGIKIVPNPDKGGVEERGELVGAYVRQPSPGKWNWMCCNDFASLYPTSIIVCNLSVENYLGSTADGTFTESQLDKYRKDKNYFVSVNGSVYKNDKDYTFKIIQQNLKSLRGETKYLSKKMDASVMSDVEHVIKGATIKNQKYSDDVIEAIKELGFDVKCSNDLYDVDIKELQRLLKLEINFMVCKEQAVKLIMNSMYGGSSHVYFEWFNIYLANDITGEGRNLIHLMEDHIPEFFRNNWENLTDVHKMLGITVTPQTDKEYVKLIYGDTDSLYTCYNQLVNSINEWKSMSFREQVELIVRLNTEFFNQHNKEYMEEYYAKRHARTMAHEFELETVALSGVWINVKKRYAQMLVWKDGKYFDEGDLPIKVKGLEVVKSSYPATARNILKGMMKTLLENNDNTLPHILNQQMQQGKQKWYSTNVESISPAVNVNNYNKYIISDDGPMGPECEKGTPFHVRGLAYYNWIRQTKHLPGDPVYNGKLKYYVVKDVTPKKKGSSDTIFTFDPAKYPKWAEQYAPIDKQAMFKKCVLDPFNRILSAINMRELNVDGSIQINMFDDF